MNPLVSILWLRAIWNWTGVVSEKTGLPKWVALILVWTVLALFGLLLAKIFD
jgi:hypothetical protein